MAYSHKAGTDGTVTVPDGKKVLFYAAASESGGMIARAKTDHAIT